MGIDDESDKCHDPLKQRAHIDTGYMLIKRCFSKKEIKDGGHHYCILPHAHDVEHKCGCGVEWHA